MGVKATFLTMFLAFTMLGCSSTGSSRHDANISKYEAVYFSDDIGVFDQKYLPAVARTLERNGLKVVTKKSGPNVLMCKLAIDQSNLFGYRVHVSLWDGPDIIFVAEAKNSGWGTLLASDAAVQNLLSSALDELDKELQRNRMQINR